MKSAQIKNQAFTAFLSGKSLREIAVQPAMPCKRTLEKWSVAERWMETRASARAEARRLAIEEQIPNLSKMCASAEEAKYQIGMKAIAQLVALVEGKLSEKDLPMSQASLIRLVKRLFTRP